MTIENRDLAPGTKLAGSYKKTTYVCEVVITAEGETRFQLEDGRLFTSPSSAGKAVMNGVSCNGWRFWSLAAEDYATAARNSLPEPQAQAQSCDGTEASAADQKAPQPERGRGRTDPLVLFWLHEGVPHADRARASRLSRRPPVGAGGLNVRHAAAHGHRCRRGRSQK